MTAAVKGSRFPCGVPVRVNSAYSASSFAIDAKRVSGRRRAAALEIFTHGGRNPTGIDAIAYAREVADLGAGELLVTSMDRDGTKSGYDLELMRTIPASKPSPCRSSLRAVCRQRLESSGRRVWT